MVVVYSMVSIFNNINFIYMPMVCGLLLVLVRLHELKATKPIKTINWTRDKIDLNVDQQVRLLFKFLRFYFWKKSSNLRNVVDIEQ